MEQNSFVYPGKQIASTSDYVTGKNVYERDDSIYASVLGYLEYDKDASSKDRINVISKFKEVHDLQIGDIVYAQVYRVEATKVRTKVICTSTKVFDSYINGKFNNVFCSINGVLIVLMFYL